jgi:hypothetical protein
MVRIGSAQNMILPNNCQDLLPDMDKYIDFFQEVGVLWSYTDTRHSQKIFELLAMRDIYQKKNLDWTNPIDNMIKDYLCHCYLTNKGELYYSSSEVIRSYLREHLKTMMEKAEMRYVELEVKDQLRKMAAQYEKQNKQILRDLQRDARERMKERIQKIVDRELSKVSYNQLFTETY